jgi:hypothetical protein
MNWSRPETFVQQLEYPTQSLRHNQHNQQQQQAVKEMTELG